MRTSEETSTTGAEASGIEINARGTSTSPFNTSFFWKGITSRLKSGVTNAVINGA